LVFEEACALITALQRITAAADLRTK